MTQKCNIRQMSYRGPGIYLKDMTNDFPCIYMDCHNLSVSAAIPGDCETRKNVSQELHKTLTEIVAFGKLDLNLKPLTMQMHYLAAACK